jgi:hypothetical protein
MERGPKRASLPADPPLPNRKAGPAEPAGTSPPAAAALGPALPEDTIVPAATVLDPPPLHGNDHRCALSNLRFDEILFS